MNQNNMQNNQVPNNFNQNPNGQMMPNNMGPGPRPNGPMPNMGPGPRPNGPMPNMGPGPGPMPNNAGPGPRPNGPMPNMGPGPGPNGPMPNNAGPGPRPNGPMPNNVGPGPRPNGPMPNMGPGPGPMPNNAGPGPRPNGPMPMGPGPRPNGPMPNMAPVPPVAPQAVPDQSPIEKHKHSSDADMVYCNGCGSLINKNSRYCMKCGSLNYSHPENMDMKKYAWVKLKDGFFVKGVSDKVNGKKGLFGSPFTVCFIFNVLLHVILALVLSSYIKTGFSNFEIEVNTLLVYGMFFIMFIYNYSMQSIYIKAGAPWWAYFIPFYGQYIFFEIAIGNGWLFLVSFIPVINIFLMIMVLYTLGKKFYRNGFLTVLFPFIMIPVIGLSDHMELSSIDSSVVDEYGRTAAEKQYKIKKLISTAIFIVIIGVVLLLYWDFFYGIAKYLWKIFVDSLKFFEEKKS